MSIRVASKLTDDQIQKDIRDKILEVPDFPRQGISFKDVTPLLGDANAFSLSIQRLAAEFADKQIELVVGLESRGFIFGAPVALALGCGFVMMRKPNKLPGQKLTQSYSLEYGEATLEVMVHSIPPGTRVLIIDDLLATGGTCQAAVQLAQRCDAIVAGCAFVTEITSLGGRKKLINAMRSSKGEVYSIISFEQ